MSLKFHDKVAKIQKELKAPKNQRNKFGNYNYRNKEDILEAVKPLLDGLVLTVNDELIAVNGKTYIKSTATITDGTNSISASAYAREAEEQKGMSAGQITGATSSYSGKYSLNNLFLIDDTKDMDTNEFQEQATGKSAQSEVKATPVKKEAVKEVETKESTPAEVQESVAKKVVKGSWASRVKKDAPKQQASEDIY